MGTSGVKPRFYNFLREVVGYDLAGFFARNSDRLREEVTAVLQALLYSEAQ